MQEGRHSWLVLVEQDCFQVDADRCEIAASGTLAFYLDAPDGAYLVSAFPTWTAVDIMSQVTGHQNGRDLLQPGGAAKPRKSEPAGRVRTG